MHRTVDFLTFFVFLIALAGNCVQAGELRLDPVPSAATAVGESDHCKPENLESLFADTEVDDPLNPVVLCTTSGDVALLTTLLGVCAAAFQPKRSTVLRI